MTKAEIINQIEEMSGEKEPDLKKLKKAELQEILDSRKSHEETDDEHIEVVPQITDHDWTDHVMSLFHEKELKDGMPTCDALRRVFRIAIGEITQVAMDVVKAPTLQDPTATVSCKIFYETHDGNDRFTSDVFDVNSDNTPFPYCKASVASAATKAEARAMRKAMGLVRVYSSEEIQEGFEATESLSEVVSDSNKPISDSAKIAITTMSQRLGIDPLKLIKNMEIEKESIDLITYVESHKVISQLNMYSRGEDNGGQAVPDEIKNEVIF